jgi:sialidase-1
MRAICGLVLCGVFAVAPAAAQTVPTEHEAHRLQAPRPAPDHVTVFRSGEHGYHTFRIPAIVRTPKGDLLAFAEGRRHASADAGDIDLVSRRSADGGRTWSDLQVVGDDGADTFGNPCVVVDRQTGVIWLFVIRTTGSDKEQAIIEGRSRSLPLPWVLSSADDGRSWTPPVNLAASIKRADWTWYSLGPGIGIQLRDGRLVVPGNHALAGSGVHRSHLVVSSDHGRSWHLGATAADGTNESQIVELGDGRVLHNMRNHPPRPGENHRAIATSTDGGLTLSPMRFDRVLIEPPAQASILSVAADRPGRRWIVFSNPASTKRERMTVRVSDDDAVSWRVSRVVYDGPVAYSCLVDLDGDIGVLYERGVASAYESIVFARLTRSWLAGR